MRRYSVAAAYLRCRTLGHAWFDIPASKPGALGGDPMWLRCERCGAERHDSISFSTGDLLGRRYQYQDGYQGAFNDQFEAAPTRADFRRMLLGELVEANRKARAQAELQSPMQSSA